MHPSLVPTVLTLPGYRNKRNQAVVRGITVRSRSLVRTRFGTLPTLFSSNIAVYTTLCGQARSETYPLMRQHATGLGANAIIARRYDATELIAGLTEVLCYGTAVHVEPADAGTPFA